MGHQMRKQRKLKPAGNTSAEPVPLAANYCVSFIDLLGQRAALKGQGLLPLAPSEAEQKKLMEVVRESVGSISTLQQQASQLLNSSSPQFNSELRSSLNPKAKTRFDELRYTNVKTQRWSDGIVSFASLGDKKVKCHVNSVYRLITLAGALCFVGLCNRRPLRGGVAIAWGIELHPGELYGAAIARSYELESEVAQYPRIVVDDVTTDFLKAHNSIQQGNQVSIINKKMAELCLSMLKKDADGRNIVHYLGDAFRFAVTDAKHEAMYEAAYEFVKDQLSEHKESGDVKLASRYASLLDYFVLFPAKT